MKLTLSMECMLIYIKSFPKDLLRRFTTHNLIKEVHAHRNNLTGPRKKKLYECSPYALHFTRFINTFRYFLRKKKWGTK